MTVAREDVAEKLEKLSADLMPKYKNVLSSAIDHANI